MSITAEALTYVIHHVFLPPQVPKGAHARHLALERVLLQCVSDALGTFATLSKAPFDGNIQAVQSMILKLIRLTDDEGGIHEKLLLEAFAEVSSKGKLHLWSLHSSVLR